MLNGEIPDLKTMIYEKGQKYIFKVRGVRRTANGTYYAIDVNGTEQYVKAYEFQRRQQPTEVQCICKGLTDNGKPAFMQDIASLIEQLYSVGDIGEFRIKGQPGTRGYYDVVDENDFCFRLVNYGAEKYYNNQMVRCRIIFINMVRVEMEPLNGSNNVSIPFYDLQQFTDLDPKRRLAPRTIRGLFLSETFTKVRKQYYEGNPLWVITALKTADENFEAFIKRKNTVYKFEIIDAFIAICRALIENSDYLTNAAEAEIAEYQQIVSNIIKKSEDARKALELINNGNQGEYIVSTLEKLRISGYIYDPVRHMRTLMYILTLCPHTKVIPYIERIFRVITEQSSNPRFLTVFAKPLAQIIDIYVDAVADDMRGSITPDDTVMLEMMIRALATRLLLNLGNSSNEPDFPIYLSMLYRYASMLVPDHEKVENLTYKAYEALFGSFARELDFTWKDVADVPSLCIHLAESSPSLASRPETSLCFIGAGQKCLAHGRMITLLPAVADHEVHNVVPEGVFTSTKVRILSPEVLPKLQSGSMLSWQRMWQEIYRAMFNNGNEDNSLLCRRRMPKVGDDVMIRIVGPSKNNNYEFDCRIEEENYWGTGTINPAKQIVAYNVKVNPDWYIDRQTGKPFLFKATVERIDPNGNISFSMRKGIAAFNAETLDADVKNLVLISRVDERQYLGITRGGVTMFIPRDEKTPLLRLGDFIVADIESIFTDGNVQGRIAGRAYEGFDRGEAFSNLVSDYADGVVYEGPITATEDIDVVKNQTIDMPAAYMRELIWVTDRKGMMQTSLPIIYSYMALAQIFATLLGDETLIRLYKRRMEIIMALSYFRTDAVHDDAEFTRFLEADGDLNEMFPDLGDSILRLRILNALDHPDMDDFLWENSHKAKNSATAKLAKLVLAHNLLSDNDSKAMRRQLRDGIFSLIATMPEDD